MKEYNQYYMSYTNGILNHDDLHGQGQIGPRGLPGLPGPKGHGYKLTSDGDYDIENKKIINVKPGTNNDDIVIKSQIQYLDGVLPAQVTNNKAVIYSPSGGVHTNNLYLKDQYGKEVHVHTEDQDLNQCRLYVPNLKNNDSYGGQRKSSVVVTSIDQTIEGKKIFSDIEVPQPVRDNQACNKKYVDDKIQSGSSQSSDSSNFVKKAGDKMTGDLVLQRKYSYPIPGNLNKVISYENTREIFLSRKETAKMEVDLDMNNNLIQNVKEPVNSDHGANKKYVDDQLVKILDKDTTIDMKDNAITNVKFPVNQKDVATVEYITQRITNSQKHFLKIDGTNSMTGDLNLNNNKIINLQTDYKDSKSAVNVDFMQNEMTSMRDLVSEKIHESHITTSGQKRDAFRYLMEDTDESSSENNIKVLGINDFPNSPHQINKKAYQLQLLFEKGSPNQYQSRLGFNLYKLPVGYHSLVVEWFPPEMNEISVTVQATTISISNYATKTFEKYTKTVINFHRWGSSPPQYIYLDLHGTVSNPSFLTIGHLIVYGVKETISNVDPSVYDTAFVIENGKMVMETDLSLNGHHLSGSVH